MITHNIKFVVMDVDGTLTDGGVYLTANGDEFKKFHAQDGLAIGILEKNGIKTALLSHAKTPLIVERRAKMLSTSFCYAGQESKAKVLAAWLTETGISAEEVLYFGDDLNDLDVMEMVGTVACPENASAPVKKVADYICERSGGEAAFRELAEKYWPHLFGL